jgi:hypothetical protein
MFINYNKKRDLEFLKERQEKSSITGSVELLNYLALLSTHFD